MDVGVVNTTVYVDVDVINTKICTRLNELDENVGIVGYVVTTKVDTRLSDLIEVDVCVV